MKESTTSSSQALAALAALATVSGEVRVGTARLVTSLAGWIRSIAPARPVISLCCLLPLGGVQAFEQGSLFIVDLVKPGETVAAGRIAVEASPLLKAPTKSAEKDIELRPRSDFEIDYTDLKRTDASENNFLGDFDMEEPDEKEESRFELEFGKPEERSFFD